jgi:hypothetical protein
MGCAAGWLCESNLLGVRAAGCAAGWLANSLPRRGVLRAGIQHARNFNVFCGRAAS